MGSGTIRMGGLCGLISAGAVIPAYLAGSPERPRTQEAANAYFADAASFVTANGTVPLLHLLFGVAFVGGGCSWH